MKTVVRVLAAIDKMLAKVSITLTVIDTVMLVVLALTEVVRRYLFGLSFSWSEELMRYMLIWMVFLGSASAYHSKNLIVVDLMLAKLSAHTRKVLALVVNGIVLVFISFVFALSLQRLFSPTVVQRISATLHISMAFAYAAPVVGLGMMVFFSLNNFSGLITNLRNTGDEADKREGSET